MRTCLRATRVPLILCALSALAAACGDTSATTTASGGGGSGASTSTEATGATGPSGGAGGAGASTSSSPTSSGGTGGAGGSDAIAPFSLLSLNLHCFRLDGTSFATNTDRFAAIASLAATRDVAVLTVQEACERPGEKAIELLRTALEQATSTTWSSTWTLAHVAWEGTPDEADEGVGLLVRGALSSPAPLDHAVQGSLHRVAVSATLPPELGGARVTSIHFEVFEAAARTMQAREAAAAALVDTDPGFSAIVAGDFNDIEGSPTHDAFPSMGFLAADSGLNATGIDHVMIHRAAGLRPTSTEEVFLGADAVSDHPGILVRLESAPGDTVSATRIIAKADPGVGHFLAIRGDSAPLSWDTGFPMRPVTQGEHAFVATEIDGGFAFKVLVDDATWQSGANVPGVGGTSQVVTPVW